jgi:hypothetical protein
VTTPDGGRQAAAGEAGDPRRRVPRSVRRRARGQPPPTPLPPGVRGQAIQDGRRAAWAGQYDEWSFDAPSRIPYLNRLRYEGEAAVFHDRERLWGLLHSARRGHRTAAQQDAVSARLARARRADAERWRRIARQRENISLQGLDILAGIGFPRLRIPWGDEDEQWPGEDAEGAADTVGAAREGGPGTTGPTDTEPPADAYPPHDAPDDEDVPDGEDAPDGAGTAKGGADADGHAAFDDGDPHRAAEDAGGQAEDEPHAGFFDDGPGYSEDDLLGAPPGWAEAPPEDTGSADAAAEGSAAGDAQTGNAGHDGAGTDDVTHDGVDLDGIGAGGGPGGEDPYAAEAEPGVPPPAPDVPARPRWLGPAGGNFAMPIPPTVKYVVLGLLILVEIPIYLKVFGYFNALDPLLTWSFTLPVAMGMVLAPHLAGKLLRNRHMLPVEPAFPYLSAVVMLLWVLAGCLLGYLRQKVLLVRQVDPLTGQSISLVSQLHLSPWTMTCVFAIVLLLSGLIAFILGLAELHPAVAAYRNAVTAREEAEAAYLDAIRMEAEATDSDPRSEDDALTEQRSQAEDRQTALWAEHMAARAAYLDAIALEMGQPALTQAVGGAIDDPPVMPAGRESHGG